MDIGLLILAIVVEVLTIGISAALVWAGGMSDNITAGADVTNQGCVIFIVGTIIAVFLLIISIVG